MEAKRARSEYDKMILRQELEEEELRVSQDAALKELQDLQVGYLSHSHSCVYCPRSYNKYVINFYLYLTAV